MVKALIDISEQTNHTINIIKAKHNFNDKGQVIAYVLSKFIDEEQDIQFSYMNDGDNWMLGEDIPDIDFYFSQIWLSSFVNEFASPSGKAYKKIACIYKGNNLKFYYGTKDADLVAENITRKFLEDPEFTTKVNNEIVRTANKLRKHAETIPIKNLQSLSNEELWTIHHQQDEIHTEYYQWGWIPVAVDMFHDRYSESLKNHLKSKGFSETKINEYFVVLTQPTEKSLIQIEQEEFLHLAKKISQDTYHRNLFKELYSNFREKDAARYGYKTHTKEYEHMLERKSIELMSHIKPPIMKQLKAHYEKYAYVNHLWVGKAHTLEYYLKELVKLIQTHSNIDATLLDIKKEFTQAKQKKDQLLKKIKLDSNWSTLFDSFGNFMITKIYRRFAQIYAIYKMGFFYREIARRFDIPLLSARFLLPEEMKRLLFENFLDKEELEKRSKFCVYYAEKGKDKVFTGIKAEKLADELQTIHVEDVSEFKGQVACLGKAKGKARIINNPEDMHKMKKGDILISIATNPDIVTAMKKAAAIVTEQGGVTSHAAIVSREMNIPCVIGTKIATKVLKDGDLIEVDAEKGIITKL